MLSCFRPMRLIFASLALSSALATIASAADLGSAEKALLQGRAADAITGLRAALSANPSDARAHLLLCRAYYAEEVLDRAVSECEAAVSANANSSEAQDWLGRTYGLKADRSGPFSGYSFAKKTRSAFEAAVNLDPANGEAVDDLGEYYVRAPGIVGGGVDKANALAERSKAHLPERASRILALIAEKQKDYAGAERNFRAAIDVTNGRADTWVELGRFYGRRQDFAKADDAFQHSYVANRRKDASLVQLATALDEVHRNPQLAERALREYLASSNQDDTAPTFKAHTMLAKLLADRGDKDGARSELSKALSLAPDYAPAKKALASL